jgi:hypothetical protein
MKFFNKLTTQQQRKYKTILRKLIYRPKAGILRAKWLEELELKKELEVTTRFTKRNIGKCWETAAK